ncbi:MAG: hypothetical protein A2722_00085 [Candidatus Doudnabacteria bacterium RIFCSPHIGHO2_01_FULL_50_11]|uniref:Uncharacterized protein n=1 Tax=Candidatus Doudnabacteria bacterium RIFCSPHIGHO2_01_FULL_50_11 TaxID=1817828 RepID=A0A1F5PJ95_9BACT|nr:MAG: hypothetical protein A2722_00085 [Candidatus Doudnabacteria bacterium RIFCSPHIGHO2_01_FULL_50_11]HLC44442.1 hypothetical protein [Patescibacteria group bacterium]
MPIQQQTLPPCLAEIRKLTQHKAGVRAKLRCYHFGCPDDLIPVILMQETYLHPLFDGSEKFRWDTRTTSAVSYTLKEHVQCSKCKTVFNIAILFAKDPNRATIFGYDSYGE